MPQVKADENQNLNRRREPLSRAMRASKLSDGRRDSHPLNTRTPRPRKLLCARRVLNGCICCDRPTETLPTLAASLVALRSLTLSAADAGCAFHVPYPGRAYYSSSSTAWRIAFRMKKKCRGAATLPSRLTCESTLSSLGFTWCRASIALLPVKSRQT